MQKFQIISLSHKDAPIDVLGAFFVPLELRGEFYQIVKEKFQLEEFMYLATCNRIEFVVVGAKKINLEDLFSLGFFKAETEKIKTAKKCAKAFSGQKALQHFLRVACSLESMVVGEREILGQIKQAYAEALSFKMVNDYLKISTRKVIEIAKKAYVKTEISKHAVSVSSVAFKKLLQQKSLDSDTKMLVVGAGQTMYAFCRLAAKKGVKNVSVYNRTKENAIKLASVFSSKKAFPLTKLETHSEDFDVLVCCTASKRVVVDFGWLKKRTAHKAIAIDLAVPFDIDRQIKSLSNYSLIDVMAIEKTSQENIKKRQQSIQDCEVIITSALKELKVLFQEREVELAMKQIPIKVKALKAHAINTVFAKDLEGLDDSSKQVLDRVLNYMEKKYISEPMKMAKEILIDSEI